MDFELRPDFVIIGAKALLDGSEGVHLLASNDVARTSVEIDWMGDYEDEFGHPLHRSTRPSATYKGRLRSFRMSYNRTYAEAWASLLGMDPATGAWQAQDWARAVVSLDEVPEALPRGLPPGT